MSGRHRSPGALAAACTPAVTALAAVVAVAALAALPALATGRLAAAPPTPAQVEPAEPTETIAITGATVHTMGPAGILHGATVLIAGGRIQAVGAGIPVPASARRVDAAGKLVTPGLFDSLTQLGLVEVSAVEDTEDSTNEDPHLSAAFDVADGLNPRSMLLAINRIEGVTRTVSVPASGKNFFLGQGAVIHLGGGPSPIVRRAVAQFVALGETGARTAGGTRGGAVHRLREALGDALDYAANRGAFEHNARRAYALPKDDLEALVPVARGQQRLVVTVNSATDVEQVLGLARELKLRVILAEAAEAWKVAPAIAAAHVPVLINPLTDLPGSFETLGATLENAARLARAGVTMAFFTGDAHNSRNIRQAAGNAVANGLPWEAALAAMTVNPARIWGIDEFGTIEPGKDADVVIWDGDPLEVTSAAERVFIRGVEMPRDSRQIRLRDRYLRRGAGQPPG